MEIEEWGMENGEWAGESLKTGNLEKREPPKWGIPKNGNLQKPVIFKTGNPQKRESPKAGIPKSGES